MGDKLTGGTPWYASKGIWGSLIAIGASAVAWATGHSITPEDQGMLTDAALSLANSLSSLVGIVGGILAWYGRYSATTKISSAKI